MANTSKKVCIHTKDENGEMVNLYPVTNKDNVIGLNDELEGIKSNISEFFTVVEEEDNKKTLIIG